MPLHAQGLSLRTYAPWPARSSSRKLARLYDPVDLGGMAQPRGCRRRNPGAEVTVMEGSVVQIVGGVPGPEQPGITRRRRPVRPRHPMESAQRSLQFPRRIADDAFGPPDVAVIPDRPGAPPVSRTRSRTVGAGGVAVVVPGDPAAIGTPRLIGIEIPWVFRPAGRRGPIRPRRRRRSFLDHANRHLDRQAGPGQGGQQVGAEVELAMAAAPLVGRDRHHDVDQRRLDPGQPLDPRSIDGDPGQQGRHMVGNQTGPGVRPEPPLSGPGGDPAKGGGIDNSLSFPLGRRGSDAQGRRDLVRVQFIATDA